MQIKYYNNDQPNSLSCFCWFVFSIKPSLLSFAHCGESICLPVIWSWFKSQCPDAIYGLSLLMVLYVASRGFPPGTPVLPSPQIQIYIQIQFRSGTQGHISFHFIYYWVLRGNWNYVFWEKSSYSKTWYNNSIATSNIYSLASEWLILWKVVLTFSVP